MAPDYTPNKSGRLPLNGPNRIGTATEWAIGNRQEATGNREEEPGTLNAEPGTCLPRHRWAGGRQAGNWSFVVSHWVLGNWAFGSGHWATGRDSNQRSAGSGQQLTSGFWSLVSGLWSLVSGLWSLVSGLWSLVSGLWEEALGTGQSGNWKLACPARGPWGPELDAVPEPVEGSKAGIQLEMGNRILAMYHSGMMGTLTTRAVAAFAADQRKGRAEEMVTVPINPGPWGPELDAVPEPVERWKEN